MLNRINTLIVKELLAVWRDKATRMVLIVPPIIQLLIFAFAATLEVSNTTLGIVNHDHGIISKRIEDKLMRTDVFSKIYHLNDSEVNDFINMEKGLVVIRFDQAFSEKVLNKKEGKVQVIVDGRKSNSAQIVEGYIAQIINQYSLEYMTHNNLHNTSNIIITRNWFNPNLENKWFIVPALIAIISLMMCIVVTGLSVAREKELGTFEQLLVSPIQPLEILIGKTVPGLIIGLAEATFLFLITILVFRIPFRGSILLFYFNLVIFLFSVLGVGLFISSLAKTQQQAILGAFIFMAPAILLSGFATPIENMPAWLQPITAFNPLRYFMFILRGLFLKDIPIAVVAANLLPLVVISILMLTGAACFFRRRLK